MGKPSDDTRSEEEEFFFTPVNDQMGKPQLLEAKMEASPKFVHNGGGFVTEVKHELSDGSAWKQMTSQAGPMTIKPRVDPYSKVVLSDAGLGLSGIEYGQVPISGGYEYNIPVTNTILSSSPYTATTSRVGGKRSSKEAENDSASILIPRQMERQQSSITTPNVSSNLSEILQNCNKINDL